HLEAKLNYRKFTWFYSHFAFEGKPEAPDLPIVTLAAASTDICVTMAAAPPNTAITEADGERWNDYGIGLFRQGDLTGALHAFIQVTQIKPKYADGYVNVARVLIEEGETREAMKWTDRAIQLDPKIGRAHFFRGLALKAEGDYDGALQELRIVAEQ